MDSTHAIGNIVTDVSKIMAWVDHIYFESDRVKDSCSTTTIVYCCENSGELTWYTPKVTCWATDEYLDAKVTHFTYTNLAACETV